MIIEGKDVKTTLREEVDVCIIGSGAGGAVVAKELAEQGARVVVLEEGGVFSRKDFSGNIKDSFNTLYRNKGLDTTAGIPAVIVPTGKCLGGTTVVNMGTCFRAPATVLNEWVELGLTGYTEQDMAPYYDRVEQAMSVQPVKPEVMGGNGEIIALGAKKLGLHPKPISRNVNDDCKGCGNCAYGCTEDAKQSMILNYIPQASEAGATFYCNTRAEGFLTGDQRVLGVTGKVYDHQTGQFRHNVDIAAKVVVLCAGALHSPALLLKNKLANRSGQVGRNLKLHLCGRVMGIFDQVLDSFRGVCQNLYIEDYIDQGIMLEATFTAPASQYPGLMGIDKELWEDIKDFRRLAALGVLISDSTSGRIRADGNANPIISYNTNQQDADLMKKAMLISARILFAAGAKKILTTSNPFDVIPEVTDIEKMQDVKVKPSDFGMMAFHPMGTCRMGVDPKKSVVDQTGKCHDLENLYIADAGIFPTSLGVNPQETIWAMATRIAEHIAKDAL